MKFFKVVLFLITLFTLSNLEANAQSRFNRENRPVKIAQPTGIASYYGRAWNGRKTACGEVFNTDSFTCAHRTLPFGTILKVTNKKNGKSVVVRVTDRGPYAKGRIIDLTLAAAKKIDMVNSGVVPVEIAQVYTPSTIPTATDNDNPVLPEMQLFDPVTGNYYSMSEWQQREQHRRDMAKAKTSARQNTEQTATAKAAQPKTTAKPVAQAKAPATTPAKPAAKTTAKTTAKPVAKTTAKPAAKTTAKPAAKTATTAKPAAKTATTAKPAAKTATTAKPAAKTATTAKPAAKTAPKATGKPVAQAKPVRK